MSTPFSCDNRIEPLNSATELFRSTDVRGAATATMPGVTQILASIERGDPHAAEQLLPLVYDELRKLAAAKMAQEASGQTLQPTALVHEAYLRLVNANDLQHWNGRAHFFGAAAEAMRRILVENARRRGRDKRGGDWKRVSIDRVDFAQSAAPGQLLALDEALERLAADDETAALLVKLRFFAGFSIERAGETLEISRAAAYRLWAYARAWLHCALRDADR